MVISCVAINCYNRQKKESGISFHVFPQRYPEVREQWVVALRRANFVPSRNSRVCSAHFLESDYQLRPNSSYPLLKEDAVPSVFDFFTPSRHNKKIMVEFKPEMWEENGEKTEEATGEPPAKRSRGRPKKQVPNVKKTGGIVVVKSEVVSCCALACPNTSESFIMNSLPQVPALRKLWVEKIDRLDWSPDVDSALCEVHFDEEMWDQDVGSDKALRPDAVPSLFLHGEAIKSWVTMDNTGNIADIIVDGRSTNDEESTNGGSTHGSTEESMDGSEQDEEEDPSMFVKREALEPEIDMVEGSEEDMVSREASSGEQFETIYCDSTFNDHEDSEDGLYEDKEDEDSPMIIPASMEEENPLADERASPILQDGEVSCLEDSKSKTVASGGSKYMVISASKEQTNKEKVIKRRSSSQLTDEFQCPICDRRLSRRKNLEIHIEKLHPFGEISEYQKKRKEIQQVTMKQEDAKKVSITRATVFKKPPPPLKPIVPQCLISPSIPVIPLNTPTTLVTTSAPQGVLTTSFPIISFSSQSPLVSSSIQTTPSTIVTPSLVASQPLITAQPLVTPTALIASPNLVASSTAGTLISTSAMVTTPRPLDPSPTGGEMRKQFLLLLPKQTVIPKSPPLKKPIPPHTEQPSAATDDSSMFSVNLSEIPLDRRLRLKDKLRELVDAVVKKNLNPDKIIIAYDRT